MKIDRITQMLVATKKGVIWTGGALVAVIPVSK